MQAEQRYSAHTSIVTAPMDFPLSHGDSDKQTVMDQPLFRRNLDVLQTYKSYIAYEINHKNNVVQAHNRNSFWVEI